MFANPLRRALLGDGRQASRFIVWLVGFFAFLNVYSVQSVLPLMMADFHASPLKVSMTVGATVFAIALISPFMGMLSDSFGRKRVLCSSLFALTLPTLLIPLCQDLGAVIALRFLQGLSIPGIVVVMMAYIAEEFRSGGVARMTATYVSGTVMGGFCGRFLTGHAGHWMGWRGAFFALAAANLAGALFVLWRLPASRGFVPNKDVRGALRVLRSHLRNRRLLAACAVGFCVLFSLVGSFTYVNFLLAAPPFNLSTASLANIFMVYLIGVVVTPLAGRGISRVGFARSLAWALMAASCGLLLTLLPSLAAIVFGLILCSSGVFVCQTATISFIATSVSEGRSLATGLYNMCYYAGGAASTGFVGLAFEDWGWQGAVLVLVGVQLLAAGIASFGWGVPPKTAADGGQR